MSIVKRAITNAITLSTRAVFTLLPTVDCLLVFFPLSTGHPHFGQITASSSNSFPHLGQYFNLLQPPIQYKIEKCTSLYNLVLRPEHSLFHGLVKLDTHIAFRRPLLVEAALHKNLVHLVKLGKERFRQDDTAFFSVDDDTHRFHLLQIKNVRCCANYTVFRTIYHIYIYIYCKVFLQNFSNFLFPPKISRYTAKTEPCRVKTAEIHFISPCSRSILQDFSV